MPVLRSTGMHAPTSLRRAWLHETLQLDLAHPKVRATAQRCVLGHDTLQERARSIHDFVRALPFGAFSDVSHVRASDVLREGRGDCHSKGVLFVALCRAAGLPARLKFVEVRARFLQGILDGGPDTIAHAVGQVRLGGRWISTDSYVVDPVLFAVAKVLLARAGSDCGWGIVADSAGIWDAHSDRLQQYTYTDVVEELGIHDDPHAFYEELSQEVGAPTWVARLKYALGAQLVNRRVAALRGLAEGDVRAG